MKKILNFRNKLVEKIKNVNPEDKKIIENLIIRFTSLIVFLTILVLILK
jgi:hypothetical protein